MFRGANEGGSFKSGRCEEEEEAAAAAAAAEEQVEQEEDEGSMGWDG